MTSRASWLAQRPPWLVRFPRPDGRSAAGAGVLIGPRHVVTCAHVLDKQFGRHLPEPGHAPAAPVEVVEVEFPFVNEPEPADKRKRARVVGWVPIAADGSGDVALLELESELDLALQNPDSDVAYTPAPLASPPSLSGHEFFVHGFPDGDPATRHVTGLLRGASGPNGPWVQLDPEGASGWAVEPGFSGAPIFDKSADAVVGIVVLKDKHRTGHMLPMSYLRGLWPEVRSNCRWRLDLEASYRTHWGPRARGSEPSSRTKEWFFTGRTEARRVIRDWLEGKNPALAGHSMLLVTGGPGSGKSALLAHSLVASDPLLSRTVPTSGPCPPIGAFDAAVYLKGRTCDEATAQLARALNVTASDSDELVAAVSEYPRGKRLTVLADAVEEAASVDEAVEIAALLRELTNTGRIRVLAAVRSTPAGANRQEILSAFGRSTPRIDLEDSQYLHRPDVAEYVARRLASEQADSARYRAYGPDQLRDIGEKVARKGRYNFLIAQLTTSWLTDPSGQQSGPGDPGWEAELPETVGQAMDRYLRACRPDTDTVKRLLTALAYAHGEGLPRGATWLRMAAALASDDDEPALDLDTVFESAAQHLVERVNEGSGPHTYRLFHDALDQHLRETLEREYHARERKHHMPEASITAVLTDAVPCGRDEERNWAEADAYTLDHLASHAFAAGQLDTLISDADYLVHATPRNLIRHLYAPSVGSSRRTAAVYRNSVNLHATTTPDQRRQILALDAARAGTTSLQQQLARRIPEGDWVPQWATRGDFSPALRDSLTGHGDDVQAVACTAVHGTRVAVTAGDDKTVRLWDLASGAPIGQPFLAPSKVEELACTSLDGSPIAVTIDLDRMIRVWDLASGSALGHAPTAPMDPRPAPDAIACTIVDGKPIAITHDAGGTLWRWELASGTPVGHPLAKIGPAPAVVCTTLDGVPVAVTATSSERPVRVWDLATGAPIGSHPDIRRYGGLMALACTELNGRQVAVTANSQKVEVWDLASGAAIGSPLTYHSTAPLDFVVDVACASLGSTPVAVTVHSEGEVRVWDLASGALIGQPLLGHTDLVHAVACTSLDGKPIAVTTGRDRTVRLWDLTAGSTGDDPPAGHTGQVTAAACTSLSGRPIAITTSRDESIRLWDLTSGTPIGQPLLGHTGPVNAVACTSLDGKPIAVTAGEDKTVRLWDLASGTPIGQPMTGHTSGADGVACTTLRGRPVAVTIGSDSTAWVWDLISRTLVVRLISPVHDHVYTDRAIACTSVNGAPIVVTGGPPAVRAWDLTSNIQLSNDSDHMTDSTQAACTVLDRMPVAVTADGPGTAYIWSLTTGARIGRPLVGDASRMRIDMCADLDGTPVAVTTGDHEAVHVWDLRTGEVAGRVIANRVDVVTLGEEGHLVVGMGRDIAVFTRRLRRSSTGSHPVPDV